MADFLVREFSRSTPNLLNLPFINDPFEHNMIFAYDLTNIYVKKIYIIRTFHVFNIKNYLIPINFEKYN
jgi:hypothetical protein